MKKNVVYNKNKLLINKCNKLIKFVCPLKIKYYMILLIIIKLKKCVYNKK